MIDPKQELRKQHLVQHRLQLDVALSMVATLTALTVLFGVSLFVFSGPVIEGTSAATRWMAFGVTGLYFLLAACVTLVVGVRVTQRIAGPAQQIEAAVRGLREGDLGVRLELRRSDHLQSLAGEVAALREDLRANREARDECAQRIQAALLEGELERVREVARDLVRSASDAIAPQSSPKSEAGANA